jgi:TM2 domain-containing membrane protein YozV/DNA-directed RNA polymerase subunit RPC12/RpoP
MLGRLPFRVRGEPPVIRFGCPTCKTVLSAADDQVDSKLACPTCGQRLQVPAPPNKTVLGQALPEPPAPGESPFEPERWASAAPPPRKPFSPPPPPSGHVIECPGCKQKVSVPHGMVGQDVQCPYCKATFATTATADVAGVADGGASKGGQKYCHECGAVINAKAVICPKCGVAQPRRDEHPAADYDEGYSEAKSNRIAAGIIGIMLGALGIHKFILGYPTAGVIMLLVSILGTCLYGLGPLVMCIIGFVEGIIYLTKSDQEFYRTYVLNKRPWF